MKKVLVISNPYNPMKTIGTKRITKFLKYMEGSEWEPIVFAPKVMGWEAYDQKQFFKTIRVPMVGPTQIYQLARKLFPKRRGTLSGNEGFDEFANLKQSRGRSYVFNKWLFIPDESIFWGVYAALRAVSYARKHQMDICFVSGPEYSSFIAGMLFSKIMKIKLISDFRDPWIDSEFNEYKTKFHYAVNKYFEKQVVRQSSKVITVSPSIQDFFMKRYKDEPEQKFTVLYNGYDDDENMLYDKIETVQTDSNSVVITHTGKFYGQKNPGSFLEGLKLAKEMEPKIDVKVQFVGGVDPSYIEYAKLHDIDVIEKGFVSYQESIQYQKHGDLLLLIPGPGKGTITGKFFEYLHARRPILCVGIPGSDLDGLIKKTSSGVLADVDSPKDIADKIILLFNALHSGESLFSYNNIKSFDFRVLTEKLLYIFNEEIERK